MITKKINNETFAWDPTSYRGKGYWFVVGKNGTFARAASKSEYLQLGNPGDQQPVSPKVYEKSDRLEQYKKADEIRKSKFSESVINRLLEGKGLGSSLKETMGERTQAKFTGIKEFFDPLNMLHKALGGGSFANVMTAWAGNKNPDLVRRFIGNKKDTATKMDSSKTENQNLGKIYDLLKTEFDRRKKLREIDKNFEKVRSENEKQRFEKLLEAIESMHAPVISIQDVTQKKTSKLPWILSLLAGLIPFIKKWLNGFEKSVIERLSGFFVDFLKKVYDFVSPIIKGIKNVIEDLFSKIMKIPFVRDALDGIKSVAKKAGGVIEDVADRLGIKGIVKGVAKTATKIAGGALDGAEGVLKFIGNVAEKFPVVGAAIAAGQIGYEVHEAIELRKEGKITDAQLHKKVVKIIGNVLGGIGGAELGGVLGSFIPVPLFGTLGGALVGGIAGSYGGEWIAGKLYKYFQEHNGKVPALTYKKLPQKMKKAYAAQYDEFIGGNDNPYRTKISPAANRTSSGTIAPLPSPKNAKLPEASRNMASMKTTGNGGTKIAVQTNIIPAKSKTEGNSTVTGGASVRDPSIKKISNKNQNYSFAI